MIRRVLQNGYDRTLGSVFHAVSRPGGVFSDKGRLVEAIYMAALVAVMAGFVSAIFFPVADEALAIYPASGSQTIFEGFIDAFVVLLGAGGIYFTYLSGRQTTKPRLVNLYLALAILFIFMSIYLSISISNMKG